MVDYSTDQRRSLRWTGSNWEEEVLTAASVEIDTSNFDVISGATVSAVLDATDNVFNGFEVATASGVLIIDDISNVSGVVGGTLGDFDVLNLVDGADSIFRFSFTVPAQPVDPVHIRVLYAPRSSGSGNVKLDLDYNLFETGDDVDPGSFVHSGTLTDSIANELEECKIATFTIPATTFSNEGSAPFLAVCQVTRDTSVGSNFGDDISVISIYIDNIPGGVLGNTAGYIGGNLTVDGDLTVEGLTVLEGGTVPASGTATATSGSLVIGDNYIYAATTTNKWKRTALSNF